MSQHDPVGPKVLQRYYGVSAKEAASWYASLPEEQRRVYDDMPAAKQARRILERCTQYTGAYAAAYLAGLTPEELEVLLAIGEAPHCGAEITEFLNHVADRQKQDAEEAEQLAAAPQTPAAEPPAPTTEPAMPADLAGPARLEEEVSG